LGCEKGTEEGEEQSPSGEFIIAVRSGMVMRFFLPDPAR
jgi:hypothetical protein